jgi:hypothetical protein
VVSGVAGARQRGAAVGDLELHEHVRDVAVKGLHREEQALRDGRGG